MDNKALIELLETIKANTCYTHRGCPFWEDIDQAIHSLQSQEARGCTLCANGNDLPEGEYCRACGLENNISPLRRAVKLARGSQSVPEFPVTFSAQSQEAEPVAGEADPLLQFDPVAKGHKREWVACNTCGRVANYDYVPYSMSHPILTLPCGHGAAERFDEATIKITEEEARKYFLAKRATQPPKAQNAEPWSGHKFKEVQRGVWKCKCGKGITESQAKAQIPEGERWFAVQSVTGVHIGLWSEHRIAADVQAEHPESRILELVLVSPKPPTEG